MTRRDKMDGEGGKVSDWKGIILSSNANPANNRAELINGLFEHFHPFLHIALIFLQIHITQLTYSSSNNQTWQSFQTGGENIVLLQKKRDLIREKDWEGSLFLYSSSHCLPSGMGTYYQDIWASSIKKTTSKHTKPPSFWLSSLFGVENPICQA